MGIFYGLTVKHVRGDLFGGLTAAIVALPLALAFGVSSGAGAIAGIYGAICVGLFAALFGGTPAQVSGPTGPMTVVMAGIFTHYAALNPESGPAIAFTVVMLGGLFQVLFGVFRLGQFITLMPFPVISGFMTGIGTIIILLQLSPLLGADAVPNVITALSLLPSQLIALNKEAFLLGCLTLGMLFFCPKAIARWVPPPLLALCLGTALSVYWLGSVPVIGEIPTGLPVLQWPTFDALLLKDMLISALMLATLGSIDSLLTSLVADTLTRTQHRSDKELIGQGLGNMVAGLCGGLPGAGATMRTVVNIRAGGRTPLSGSVHALVLLLVVLGAGSLAEHIPLAVLAGLLLKVGIDIIDWRFLARAHHSTPFVFFLMVTVWFLTVFVDLITAVAVGVFLANIYTVRRLSDTQVASLRLMRDNPTEHQHLTEEESRLLTAAQGQVLLYQLNGPLSYAAAKGLTTKLMACSAYEVLILDFTNVPHIDVTTALAIEEIISDAEFGGQQVYLAGANPAVEHLMSRLGITRALPASQASSSRLRALQQAVQSLEEKAAA